MKTTTLFAVFTALLTTFQVKSQIRNDCDEQFNSFLVQDISSIRAQVDKHIG